MPKISIRVFSALAIFIFVAGMFLSVHFDKIASGAFLTAVTTLLLGAYTMRNRKPRSPKERE